MSIRVGVMFGGKSTEHEVSITSAYAVIKNLQKHTSMDVTPIYVAKNGQRYSDDSLNDLKTYKQFSLPARPVSLDLQPDHKLHLKIQSQGLLGKLSKDTEITLDVVFLVFHGKHGEDGSIEGMLEFLEIPYVGPSVVGSATTIDKRITKDILIAHGFPAIPYQSYTKKTWNPTRVQETFMYPIFVKPYNLGSSIGVSKCFNYDDLLQAADVGFYFSNEIIVEPSIENSLELSCSVMYHDWEIITTEIQQPLSQDAFLTFDQKYIVEKWGWGMMSWAENKVIVPAPLNADTTQRIKQMTKDLFEIFRLSWAPRIDYLYQPDTQHLYIIELNSIPGAMQMYLREQSWIPPKTFLESLIHTALQRKYDDTSIEFNSSILDNTISFAK